jgi:hypothetical protein
MQERGCPLTASTSATRSPAVGLDGLLILSFPRDHAFIDTLSAAKLLQLSREETRATLDRLAQLPPAGPASVNKREPAAARSHGLPRK